MPQVKELISQHQLAERIGQLGAEIARDYGDRELILICVLKGSFMFLADLARAIPSRNLAIEFLGLASYGDATSSSGVVQITSDLTRSIEGKEVLVVEDIVDTGLTMEYLNENLATRRPASIRLCSLLHKPTHTVKPVPIHYLGFTIPDLFVVGYGLDYAQKYRNLPFLGVLEE